MSVRPDPHPPSLHPDLEPGLCTALGRTMAEFDLSSLPDLVLEMIFKMLPVPDRGSLACCNRRLSAFMDIGNLWKEVNIDEFDLYTDKFEGPAPMRLEEVKVVGKLRARDVSMIKKYRHHFEKVKVVIHSSHIEGESLGLLSDLGYRDLIKSVSLRLDLFLSKVMELRAENPSVVRCSISTIFFGNGVSLPEPGSRMMYPPLSHIIDNLSPDADFTIALPPQSHIRDDFEYRPEKIYCCTIYFYHFHMPENSRSLLKKLMLSPLPLSEETIARNVSRLGMMRNVQMSPPPTVELIASFPNLQELHVNIINLSDQLLLELSGVPGKRKPLRKLVIRHIVCECEVESRCHLVLFMNFLFSPGNHVTFPQLSSAAWDKLAQSSSSLTVECSVITNKLPLLLDVIKPETPLVRLEVLGRTTSSDDQSVPVLQELSKIHSRLTIVGMRFRACSCTSADS